MTFSIAGHCARTGMFGIAVASSSPCVAARCAHARAGVGVCATQNITDPRLGPIGLDLLQSGLAAEDALAALRAGAEHVEYRQLALLDRSGIAAFFSGKRTLGMQGGARAAHVVALGNLLGNESVPGVMVDRFGDDATMPLGDRLLGAMQAGLAAGGEAGPIHSAGMVLVDRVAWPVADLRVDWHETAPLDELARLWELWRPQMQDYVTRALDPSTAPSYGVAGDR